MQLKYCTCNSSVHIELNSHEFLPGAKTIMRQVSQRSAQAENMYKPKTSAQADTNATHRRVWCVSAIFSSYCTHQGMRPLQHPPLGCKEGRLRRLQCLLQASAFARSFPSLVPSATHHPSWPIGQGGPQGKPRWWSGRTAQGLNFFEVCKSGQLHSTTRPPR